MKKHPGFAAVQKHIQKQGYSKAEAGAIAATIAAAAARSARHPRVKRVRRK